MEEKREKKRKANKEYRRKRNSEMEIESLSDTYEE